MSPIASRLRASVRMGAHNGDGAERAVCGQQMLEAAQEIERLQEIEADATIRLDERQKIIDELRAESSTHLLRARQAEEGYRTLRKCAEEFAAHKAICKYTMGGDRCTCGFNAVFSSDSAGEAKR